MIYTGYFAKTKAYEEAGLQPISIAGKAPDFYKGPQYKSFAPEYGMFMDWKKGKINNLQYTQIFLEKINKLDKEAVKRALTLYNKDVILLCYEKPGDFCHRHIVADWIEEHLGMRVDEYDENIVNAEKELIDLMKQDFVSECDISKRGVNVESFINRLSGDGAPKGFFLYKIRNPEGEPLYSLKEISEFLEDYGISPNQKEN